MTWTFNNDDDLLIKLIEDNKNKNWMISINFT